MNRSNFRLVAGLHGDGRVRRIASHDCDCCDRAGVVHIAERKPRLRAGQCLTLRAFGLRAEHAGAVETLPVPRAAAMVAGMGRIRRSGVAAVLLVTLAVTGCSITTACPAIGWTNTATIHLNGNVDGVATVELCADGVCATSDPLVQEPDEPLRVLTPEELASPAPSRHTLPSPFSISRVDERNWKAKVAMTTPETLTLRALNSTGQVLAEQDVALQWRRVGGSEQCGGPGEAGPVNLDIPS